MSFVTSTRFISREADKSDVNVTFQLIRNTIDIIKEAKVLCLPKKEILLTN